ncbi:hypothetical protein [Massilia sp. UBA6681]|uniref:hypothetical protein n=1 Tax=Massilia sp. UBA6681 TaxID=1946839 RepID=UPI0025BA2BCE|nr:hypothetical protein [Massilia sp. UBA6681]
MHIQNATVLVTGANRGLGAEFARQGLALGANKGLTNGVRDALREQGTQVLGVHVGMIDTDLTRGFDLPKLSPDTVVARSFAALEAGAGEVLVDEITRAVKQGLNAEPPLYTLA